MIRTHSPIRPLVLSLALLGSSACIRDVPEVPGPAEGTFVQGTVVERDGGTGLLTGVEGIRVSVFGTNLSARTDPDGRFELVRLPKGTFSLRMERIEDNGRRTHLKTVSGVSLLVDGQTINLGQIMLGGLGDLKGTVELTDLSLPGASEGSLVVAVQSAFRAIVDQSNQYRLAALPESDFDVVAFRAGYVPGRLPAVRVVAGASTELPELRLEVSTATVSIAVQGLAQLFPDGASVEDTDHSGIRVQFQSETSSATTREASTDSAGGYSLELVPGIYRAQFDKPGFSRVQLSGLAVLPEGVIGLVPVFLSQSFEGDVDGDGVPDASDPDRDDDGCANEADAFPDDPTGCLDGDGDGIADEIDIDDDGDGLTDAEEASLGRDGYLTNALNPDTDGDGALDGGDLCPTTFEDNPNLDGDGDGVGDACDVEPIIIDFSPRYGGPGTEVTIWGQRFSEIPERNRVIFAPGRDVALIDATTEQLVVRIDGAVETGPITVSNGRGLATSGDDFQVLPRPVIRALVPSRVGAGGLVRITGDNFRLSETGDVELRVSFEGPSGPGPEQLVLPEVDPSTGEQSVVVTAPLSTGTYRVHLVGPGGSATTIPVMDVVAGPVISSLLPSAAPEGATILVQGRNFEVGPSLSAEFGDNDGDLGGDGIVVPLAPEDIELGGSRLRVVVPVGAQSGPLTIRLANGAASALFTLDALAISIDSFAPPLVVAGEDLTIYVNNLPGTAEARFAFETTSGAVEVLPSGMAPGGGFVVTTPADVLAGPVTLVVYQGGSEIDRVPAADKVGVIRLTTSPEEWHSPVYLHVWARPAQADLALAFGATYDVGSNNYLMRQLLSSPGAIGDMEIGGPDRTALEIGAPAITRLVQGSPYATRAILAETGTSFASQGELSVYDFASNTIIGGCPATAPTGYVHFAFDPTRNLAAFPFYDRDEMDQTLDFGLDFVDLDTGSCFRVSWSDLGPAQSLQLRAAEYLDGRLYTASYYDLYEVDVSGAPGSPGFGRPLGPAVSVPSSVNQVRDLYASLDRQALWVRAPFGVQLTDATTGAARSGAILGLDSDFEHTASVGSGRFIVATDNSSAELVLIDGLSTRVSRVDLGAQGIPRASYGLSSGRPFARTVGPREQYDLFIQTTPQTSVITVTRVTVEIDPR